MTQPYPKQFTKKIPDGDSRLRAVCGDCGWIDYINPRIVVGAVVLAADGRILLCRRSIEPRRGFWTLPAGYLEEREAVEAGTLREAREEANATIELEGLLAVYSVPRISQVQLMYRARLASPEFSPGEETLETKLFTWDEIPWNELAFPSVTWALNDWAATKDLTVWAPRTNPPGDWGNGTPGGRRDQAPSGNR